MSVAGGTWPVLCVRLLLLLCPVCSHTEKGETKGPLKWKGALQMSLIKRELMPSEAVLQNTGLFFL